MWSLLGAVIVTGATSPACSGICFAPAGWYCGVGAVLSTGLPCPAGQYNNGSQGVCSLCPQGRFGNTTGLTSSNCSGVCNASAGHVCSGGATASIGSQCPVGQYSTNGSISTCSPCPNGTYGSATGLSAATCSGGCTATTGSYCGLGMTTSTGALCKLVGHELAAWSRWVTSRQEMAYPRSWQ